MLNNRYVEHPAVVHAYVALLLEAGEYEAYVVFVVAPLYRDLAVVL